MKHIARQINTRALIGLAVIAGATGCSTPSVTPQVSSNPPSAATTLVAPPTQGGCSDLGGTAGADRICRVHSVTPAYTVDMSYPLDYPDQKSLTDVLKQDRDGFVDWIARFGSDGRGRRYEHVVTAKTYRSGPADSGTQTVVLETQSDTGFAHQDHPNTSFTSLNYDLGKHVMITFDMLFKPGTQPLEMLNPIVLRELQRPGSDWEVNDLDQRTYRNFAITDDAVIFFFDQDQVIRDNSGPHEVSVPRTELAPLLA
jgi:hypothetical protein